MIPNIKGAHVWAVYIEDRTSEYAEVDSYWTTEGGALKRHRELIDELDQWNAWVAHCDVLEAKGPMTHEEDLGLDHPTDPYDTHLGDQRTPMLDYHDQATDPYETDLGDDPSDFDEIADNLNVLVDLKEAVRLLGNLVLFQAGTGMDYQELHESFAFLNRIGHDWGKE